MVTLLVYIAGLEFSPTRKEEQLPLPNVKKGVVCFGMNGLALQVQQSLDRDPHAGDLYAFRGARGI
jgi:hypothetical protein